MARLLTSNVSISNGNIKYPIGTSIIAVKLSLKLFPVAVANADIGSIKSLHTLFDKYLDYMLVKFEQKLYGPNYAKFWAFDKKKKKKPEYFKTNFWQTVDAILQDVFVAETIVYC